MTAMLMGTGNLPVVRTSVGKKAVMAVTGVILIAFITAHMVGNLKFFDGARHFDEYAEWLRRIGQPAVPQTWFLWIQRAGLLVAVGLHIWAATSLTLQSRRARPVRYVRTANVQATYAARTMRWGGVILALFVVYHLLHMTTGTAHSEFTEGAVHSNVVEAFQIWYVTAIYVVAVAALAQHLYHGVWSLVQTLGRNRPRLDRPLRRFSAVYAFVVFAGFLSVPLAVQFGYGH